MTPTTSPATPSPDPTTAPAAGTRIIGVGVLREPVAEALRRLPVGLDCDLLIVDGPDEVAAAARSAYEAGRDFLPVYPTPRGVRIGPYTTAGRPGCHACVQTRERRARTGGAAQRAALWQGIYDGAVTVPRPVHGPVLRAAVAALVADELDRAARGGRLRCAGAVLEISTATLAITRHPFIAEPGCTLCATLTDDSPAAGEFTLTSRPKRAPDDYRARSISGEHERLVAATVDAETGLLASINLHHNHPMIMVGALGGEVCCGELAGYGRTFSYPASVSVAIAEALERLGGSHPRARRTSVRATFAELGPQRAVEPTELGLPPVTSHRHAAAYHPNLPVEWVYAYSFRRGGPVLVPETFAYYGSHGTVFGSESSNGCALGGNLEEAILHGIFEVAERDAFLSTWYARLPVPRIDPTTSTDPMTRMLVHWLERTTGSRLHVFDTTMPEGIPSLWLMLVDEQNRPRHPRAFCGAGAHLDPERALWSGLVELASVAKANVEMVAADTTAPDLVADPDLVRTMDDHMLAAASPDGWERFAFLYQHPDVVSMETAFPPPARYQPAADLLQDLRQVVSRYLAGGLDVVVIDQTANEQAAVDLTSVKVLIPGLLPMVFGHRNRRVDFPRLRDLPVRLGYRSTPLTSDEINPHPHPFP
ncbi:TOMM precursor leader peptide-binding protein [Micromonospora zamorensis]|uniref:TOMM precursor leader peptide-binding protein n=1 Tax=Micromonospora zamorensis TaxID=709883 RepID=UPI0037A130EF